MGFDDLHRKRQGNLRKRKLEIKELEPLRFLIVCEGEKTEPNYFEALRKKLNDKYRKNFVTLKVECVDIIGKGRNTKSLVEYTKKIRDNAIIGYGIYPRAVKSAKRLEDLHKGQTPADSKPMTKVYELIEELKKLLEK